MKPAKPDRRAAPRRRRRDASRASADAGASMAWIGGVHAVQAALQAAEIAPRRILLDANRRDRVIETLRHAAEARAVPVETVSRDRLDACVAGLRHQGVIAEVVPARALEESHLETLLGCGESARTLLVLDGVQDPHNLGACLRTADATGATAVIVPRDRAVGLTAVVRKVAAGAAESVPLITVINLARTLERLRELGFWVHGASDDASAVLHELDLSGPTALVLGAEGTGLRRLTREHCDTMFSIPMRGSVESLNVSVAAGVVLYERLRQREAMLRAAALPG